MSHHRQAVESQARAIVAELGQVGGLHATPAEFAVAVVHVVHLSAPEQARALSYCWWGVDVLTLALLTEAGRWDTVQALWSPPAPGKRNKRYSEAAREMGKTPRAVRETVERGLRSLLAWQLHRAREQGQRPT